MIKGNWTISFLWRPESSWREVHGALPIALVRFSDNTYLSLYYEATYDGSDNRVGGQFVLTDGVNSITITADSGWLFADVLKFAISHKAGVGTALGIETPAEGVLGDNSASINLSGYLVNVQFSANADGEVKGIGAYGECQFWDTALTGANVQKVFDFDATAPAPTLRQTASQMVFARDSERYDAKPRDLIKIESGKQLSKTFLVSSHIGTPEYETTVEEDRRIMAVKDGVPYVRSVNMRHLYTYDSETESYTEWLDLQSGEPFTSDNAVYIRGLAVFESGNMLLFASDAAGKGYSYCYDGTTWTKSNVWDGAGAAKTNHATDGYAMMWMNKAIRGKEIVVGEYAGTLNIQTTARRVFYSPDEGLNFYEIYDRVKEVGDAWHFHAAAFHPTEQNVIFVSYGDSEFRNMYKLTCSGDKRIKANWVATDIPAVIQPTCGIIFKGNLYWGNDGSGVASTVMRHDLLNDSMVPSLVIPRQSSSNIQASPYIDPATNLNVFSMAVIDGVLYCAVNNETRGGLWATLDGEHWTRLFSGNTGVIDDGGDRLWIQYNTSPYVKPATFNKPRFRNVSFSFAERGVTNIIPANLSVFNDANSCQFSGVSSQVWLARRSFSATESKWDDTEKLIGNGSMKMVGGEYDGSNRRMSIKSSDGSPVTLAAVPDGHFFVITAYIKVGGKFLGYTDPNYVRPYISFRILPTHIGVIANTSEAYTALGDGWYRVRAWGKQGSGEDAGKNRPIWIAGQFMRSGRTDYPYDEYSDFEFWVDAVSLIHFADLQFSSAWQIGGTPRADEILIAPAFDVGRGGVEMAGFISGRGFVS